MSIQAVSKTLLGYAAFLVLVAIAAVSYDPEAGRIAFNARAKTALASGGMAAGVSLLWGLLLHYRQHWARFAAVATTGLFFVAFTWRAWVGWQAVADGNSVKAYAATLISLMWLASLLVLGVLGANLLARRPATTAT